jgi:hypothetical protein
MRVDPSREHEKPPGFQDLVVRGRREARPHFGDLLAANADIGVPLSLGGDDAPAADQEGRHILAVHAGESERGERSKCYAAIHHLRTLPNKR